MNKNSLKPYIGEFIVVLLIVSVLVIQLLVPGLVVIHIKWNLFTITALVLVIASIGPTLVQVILTGAKCVCDFLVGNERCEEFVFMEEIPYRTNFITCLLRGGNRPLEMHYKVKLRGKSKTIELISPQYIPLGRENLYLIRFYANSKVISEAKPQEVKPQ